MRRLEAIARSRCALPLPLLVLLVLFLLNLPACAPVRTAPVTRPDPAVGVPDSAPAPEAPREEPKAPEVSEPAREVASADSGAESPGDEPQADDAAPFDELEGEEQAPATRDELATTPPEATQEEIERDLRLAAQQAPTFDIPVVVNDKVTSWLDYYSGRHKKQFTASLERSGRYLPMVQSIFAEAGLPQDLAYFAHVESAFKPRAYSRAKAKGMFQFIAGTGRRYGLRADSWIDERSDPEKAARAAAAYLRDLHDEFDDWYLALAAYNAGEGKIRRAVARTGSRDFWEIAKTSAIRNETKNYVPAILAATLIAKDPARYGFEFVPAPPLTYETAEVRGGVDLAVLERAAGLAPESLRDLNPELRRGITPPGRGSTIRVPAGAVDATVAGLDAVPSIRYVESVGHVIRKGETLGALSKRYGVSVAAIQRANRLGSRTTLRVGRTLAIPVAGAGVPPPLDSSDEPAPSHTSATYRVRRGDTLFAIARSHGTTPAAIAEASSIPMNATIHEGDRLRIPLRASASRSQRHIDPVVHTVRKGETLGLIAARYRTSVDRLCDLNELSRSETIHPGKKLTVR